MQNIAQLADLLVLPIFDGSACLLHLIVSLVAQAMPHGFDAFLAFCVREFCSEVHPQSTSQSLQLLIG
jgi:hypothetical protein